MKMVGCVPGAEGFFGVFVDPRQADGIHQKQLIRDTET